MLVKTKVVLHHNGLGYGMGRGWRRCWSEGMVVEVAKVVDVVLADPKKRRTSAKSCENKGKHRKEEGFYPKIFANDDGHDFCD